MANLYSKGFTDGYKAGFRKGTIEPSKRVIKRVINEDLTYIYGMMCILLSTKGWSTEQIQDLIDEMQKSWVEEYEREQEEKAAYGRIIEKLPDKVLRLTGVNLVQTFGLEA